MYSLPYHSITIHNYYHRVMSTIVPGQRYSLLWMYGLTDVRNSLSPGLDIGTSLGCRDLTLDGSVWGAGSKADEYNTTRGIDICAVNVMQWTALFLVDAGSRQEGLEEGVKFA